MDLRKRVFIQLILQWDEAYAEAKERWTPHTADYLISTPLVADYLEEGLSLFGYSQD